MSEPNIPTLLRSLVDRGLTQSEISRRTGIPQPRLSKWLNGQVPRCAEDVFLLQSLADEVSPEASAPT